MATERKLYWGSGSTPAWRVLIALKEKGLEFDSKLIEFSKGERFFLESARSTDLYRLVGSLETVTTSRNSTGPAILPVRLLQLILVFNTLQLHVRCH